MTHTRPSWIPELETYCHKCRRMVAAKAGPLSGILVPAPHWVFCQMDNGGYRLSNPVIRCPGWVGKPRITHGMEDPATAFTYEPGPVTPPTFVMRSPT